MTRVTGITKMTGIGEITRMTGMSMMTGINYDDLDDIVDYYDWDE